MYVCVCMFEQCFPPFIQNYEISVSGILRPLCSVEHIDNNMMCFVSVYVSSYVQFSLTVTFGEIKGTFKEMEFRSS